MSKIPTAEELFIEINKGDLSWCKDLKIVGIETAKKLAKLHVKAALEAAAFKHEQDRVAKYPTYEEMLNAYPETNIK